MRLKKRLLRKLVRSTICGWLLILAGGLSALRAQSAESTAVHLIFIGDTGSGSDRQRDLAARMHKLAGRVRLDGVFLLGDNVYGRDKEDLFRERFLDVYRDLLSANVPFHAALGNHDVERCQVAPGPELPRGAAAYLDSDRCWAQEQIDIPEFGYSDGGRYYSVVSDGDPPLVEVFVLDSNTLIPEGGLGDGGGAEGGGSDEAQLEWLRTALDESRATWKILTMHHPIHSPKGQRALGLGHEAEVGLRERLEEIIVGKIDVVFQGHNHLYARMHPRRGVRYFVSGGGGKKPYRFVPDEDTVARPQDRGKLSHFVFAEITRDRFQYCVLDEKGVARDGGWFGKGDPSDQLLPEGACASSSAANGSGPNIRGGEYGRSGTSAHPVMDAGRF